MAAVARFRQRQFGQLLYSGDLLADTANYDPRGWSFAVSAREKLFFLTLETLITL